MKKGISLIVLVITIIVIIILAGAVILSLNNNNPVEQANTAATLSEQSDMNSAMSLYIAKITADNQTVPTIEFGSATAVTGVDANGNAIETADGYYLLQDATLKCGTDTIASAAGLVASGAAAFQPTKASTTATEIADSIYAVCINQNGNVKFVTAE